MRKKFIYQGQVTPKRIENQTLPRFYACPCYLQVEDPMKNEGAIVFRTFSPL